MKIVGDYHSHTVYSDGYNTCREMVERAHALGLKEYAITDHCFSTNILGFSMSRGRLIKQRAEIERLREQYPDMKILSGIEANLLDYDGNVDLEPEEFETFDVVQFGFHRTVLPWWTKSYFPMIIKNCGWFSQDVEKNTRAIINAMDKYPLKQLSHPNNVLKVDTVAIAEEAKKRGIRLELNEKHWSDLDPTLTEVAATGVDFILGSDSHRVPDVARMPDVFSMIEKHGIAVSRVKGLAED